MNRNNSRRKKLFSPSLPWWRMPELMSKLRALDGMSSRALEFQILTAARSSEVRGAKWQDIDLPNRVWAVSSNLTRVVTGRCIPLSDVTVTLLESLPRNESRQLVFPSEKDGGTLSIQNIVKVIDDIHEADIKRGGDGFTDPLLDKTVTPHGARHAFRQWASKKARYPGRIVALCLGDSTDSDISAAYRWRDDVMRVCAPVMREWARTVYAQPEKQQHSPTRAE